MPAFNIPVVTVYSFCTTINKKVLVDSLKNSLAHTLAQYTQFGGKLHIDDETGNYSIRTSNNDSVEFSVKYHDHPDDETVSTYGALEKDAFPPINLPSRVLLPRIMTEKHTLTQHGDYAYEGAPVSMFMLTFIRGGLILGVGLHHLSTDVSGLDGFLQAWATNTRNLAAGLDLEPFDDRILDRSQLTYSGLLPGIDRMDELTRRVKYIKLLEAIPQPPPEDFQMPNTSEVLFHFPKSKITTLKSIASLGDSDNWVSSYDSIMALCWRCITRARLPSFSLDTVSGLMHAVNGRNRLKPALPTYYIGNVAMHGRPKLTFADIVAQGAYPRLAALVRATNVEIDHALYAAAVEWVAGVPDKRLIALNMNAFLGPDIGSTSWQALTAHSTWDFGFGTPAAVRWPKPDLDGFVFYFPLRETDEEDQGTELVVCLEDEAMRRLLQDEEWASYAMPRGPTSAVA
ncbi:hypothetical protein NW762_014057 [Fusarium torreyae]|uniref:Trichothecene 3-O-acetyltransferase n=1 Tax=Fusarium torreyae TaxID=1237075 RepID=A0A9W8V9U5_9HYPO|nr:hypothetical protein NW762_014057 [Fusarium torreyae]